MQRDSSKSFIFFRICKSQILGKKACTEITQSDVNIFSFLRLKFQRKGVESQRCQYYRLLIVQNKLYEKKSLLMKVPPRSPHPKSQYIKTNYIFLHLNVTVFPRQLLHFYSYIDKTFWTYSVLSLNMLQHEQRTKQKKPCAIFSPFFM